MLPRDAHGLISHDHQETGPLAFREPYQGKQGGVVNFVSIRLTQTNNQNSGVPVTAMLGETLIGSDQHPLPGKCQCPQGDVLVHQDVHPSIAGDLNWRDLLFGERGGIVEAGHDVLAGQ